MIYLFWHLHRFCRQDVIGCEKLMKLPFLGCTLIYKVFVTTIIVTWLALKVLGNSQCSWWPGYSSPRPHFHGTPPSWHQPPPESPPTSPCWWSAGESSSSFAGAVPSAPVASQNAPKCHLDLGRRPQQGHSCISSAVKIIVWCQMLDDHAMYVYSMGCYRVFSGHKPCLTSCVVHVCWALFRKLCIKMIKGCIAPDSISTDANIFNIF